VIARISYIWEYLGHIGPELRFYLASSMVVSGAARIITGSNATPINFLPSQVYGVLLIIFGLWLLLTCKHSRRCSWNGRFAAMAAVALYLLLLLDIWGAPVSFSSVILIVLALGNEVKIYEC
jgi:hypothetical protein